MSVSFPNNATSGLTGAAGDLTGLSFPHTFICWIKYEVDSNSGGYLGMDNSAGNNYLGFNLYNATRLTIATDGAGDINLNHSSYVSRPATIAEGWQLMYVERLSATELNFYLHGVEQNITHAARGVTDTTAVPVIRGFRNYYKVSNYAIINAALTAQDKTDLAANVYPNLLSTAPIYYRALESDITTGTGGAALTDINTDVVISAADNPALVSAGPSITSMTDPVTTNTSATIVCTGAEATQGTGGVTQGGVAVTETAWSDTSVTFDSVDIETSALKYGNQTFVLTADGGGSDSITADVQPATNRAYVDIGTPATAGDRITATPTDLATGDQLVYDTRLFASDGITPTAYTVSIDDTGVFTLGGGPIPDGDYIIKDIRVYDGSDNTWGSLVNESVNISSGLKANSLVQVSTSSGIYNKIGSSSNIILGSSGSLSAQIRLNSASTITVSSESIIEPILTQQALIRNDSKGGILMSKYPAGDSPP